MSEEPLRDREADPADAADQRRGVDGDADVEEPDRPAPDDADPADAAEQRRAVPLDEDDYR